ncbi:retrovirus-related pol polyprotein from transposon TNT 1-94 [Tanacetum coccineum]
MSIDPLSLVGGGGGTLGGGDIVEVKYPLVDGDVEEVGDLSLESMEDEEVATVDEVFESAFGALGDKTWFGGGSFGGCHGGLWWLIMDKEDDEVVNLIRSENDILAYNGVVQLDMFQLKKSTNIIESRKIGVIQVSNNVQLDDLLSTYKMASVFIHHLGKFDGKADEGFFVGYSINSKAFIVFNSRTRIVKENLHVQFSENTPNIAGSRPYWIFDIDALTKSMNYKPVIVGNQSNGNAGTKACDDASKAKMETVPGKDYILLPLWPVDLPFFQNSKSSPDAGFKPSGDDEKKVTEEPGKECGDSSKEDESNDQEKDDNVNSTNNVNAASTNEVNAIDDDEDVGAEADMNNLDAFMPVSTIPTTIIHKDHPVEQIIGDLNLTPQTRRMTKNLEEHGIDYDEVFAPIARIEAIGLFLAYALFKDFVVYQMDVKSAFLYGKIKEEVYVCQPLGFDDPDFSDKVYKVEKALYGQHQAPRAWYETLSTYLLDSGFQRGKIDKTLFIRRDKGLQVKQKEDGIFISQDKYVTEILKKFGFTDVKTASTPMETQKPLLKDEDGEEVDVHLYRSMIGSLMYLTSSRPDIMFAVCACARYQVNPKVSHLHAVKRIFRYLKGQPKLGLWYPKDSPFDLVAYTDSDYAGASLDRKSSLIKVVCLNSLGVRLISCNARSRLWFANFHNRRTEYVDAYVCYGQVKTVNEEQQLQALVGGKKIIITEATVRRDLQLEDAEGIDCLSNADIFEQLTLMGYEKLSQKLTFYKAFFSPQWKFLIHTVLQCLSAKTTAWNEFSSTMASAIICLATNQKFNFSKYTFESMLKNLDNAGKFLMYPRRPKEKDTQVPQSSVPSDPTNVADEAVNEEPKKKGGSRTHKLKRLYRVGRSARVVSSEEASLGDQEDASKQGRKIDDIDKDAEITLVDETQGRYGDEDMFGVNDLDGDEVVVESEVTDKAGEKRNIVEEAVAVTDAVTIPVSAATITNVELTLAQTLAELKSARPKTKGVVMQEPSESTPTISLQLPSQVKGQGSKDKGKAKMIEPEKPLKKKDQIKFDEEEALRLQAKLQAQEQYELTIEEKSTLFVQLLEKRKKHFAAKRAEEKRNMPPTRAQQRSIMCTYLKNMAGWKPKDLKNKSFANIQELFDKAFKRVNTFVDFKTELVEGTKMEESLKKAEVMEESSSKRARDELEQDNAKKQKVDDDQEAAKMKELMKIVPDKEEVAVDAIPLATKPTSIVD